MRATSLVALVVAVLVPALAPAAEHYVSPDGKPDAAGTKASPWDIVSTLTGKQAVRPGDTVWLTGGVYVTPTEPKIKRFGIECRLKGTPDKPIIVRQAPGERATIDGSLQIYGSDTWYRGFEVRGTRGTKRESGNSCLNILGPRIKMINLIVHRGQMGSGFWTPSVDSEQYGCLFFDFGFWSPRKKRGGGHACYTQNATGTKRIVDNMMFAGYGWNFHAYTQSGQITGFHVEGNFVFSAGMGVAPTDAPKDNVIICGYPAADRITFRDNVVYHPRTGGWRYNVRLSTYKAVTNGAATVTGNTLVGYNGLALDRWLKMTATGNEIWAPMSILEWKKGKGAKEEDWIVDRNTYHALPDDAKFNGRTFAAHQASGLDRNSRLLKTSNGRPTGTRAFVRPNRYEPGRAHVAVLSFDGLDAVEVDLKPAGLKSGAKYQIRNVLDLYGKPVAEGVYDGKPVSLPMMKSAVAPDFDAFLVIPAGSFGSFRARGDELKMAWTTRGWEKPKALNWVNPESEK